MELFASDLNTDRLIMGIELYVGRKIDPNNTLLIFDEVQEVPRALSSLKYFYENAPQYHIVCAGSPSLILRVRLISFGITIRPRSSILLTIPVAFILHPPVSFLNGILIPFF